MSRQKTITWSLMALLVVLLWDFGQRALFYSPLSPSQSTTRPGVPEKLDNTSDLKPSWGPEIEARDLFSQGRSARASASGSTPDTKSQRDQAPPPKEQLTEIRPNLTLSGIIINQFGEYVAYVILDNQNPIGVRIGEELGGAKVTAIDKRSVTLNWKGSAIKLSLSSQPLIKR